MVYGGDVRQSRSNCEVVPLAELGGVLQRFDVEQELAVFLKEKEKPEGDIADAKVLDIAYNTRIPPMLEELESALRPLARLFRGSSGGRFGINWGQPGPDGMRGSVALMRFDQFLQSGYWETAKRNLVEMGLDLNGGWRCELRYDREFSYYTGECLNRTVRSATRI